MTRIHLTPEEHDAYCRWAHQFAVDAGAVAGIVLRSYGLSRPEGRAADRLLSTAGTLWPTMEARARDAGVGGPLRDIGAKAAPPLAAVSDAVKMRGRRCAGPLTRERHVALGQWLSAAAEKLVSMEMAYEGAYGARHRTAKRIAKARCALGSLRNVLDSALCRELPDDTRADRIYYGGAQ